VTRCPSCKKSKKGITHCRSQGHVLQKNGKGGAGAHSAGVGVERAVDDAYLVSFAMSGVLGEIGVDAVGIGVDEVGIVVDAVEIVDAVDGGENNSLLSNSSIPARTAARATMMEAVTAVSLDANTTTSHDCHDWLSSFVSRDLLCDQDEEVEEGQGQQGGKEEVL